jgi:hypothetical protein
MNRYISTIISKFSILLGINCQENRVSGLAIQGSSFSRLVRSLGLRLGSGSSWAGSHVMVRVSSAPAGAIPAPVYKHTSVGVPPCWRPATVAWRDSDKIRG